MSHLRVLLSSWFWLLRHHTGESERDGGLLWDATARRPPPACQRVQRRVAKAFVSWEGNAFLLTMSCMCACAIRLSEGASRASARLAEQRWPATSA